MSPRARSLTVRIVLGVAVVIGVAIWLRERGNAAEPASGRGGGGGGGGSGERSVPVKVAPVEVKDVPIWLEGLGSVSAFQQVTVHAQVDGLLQQVMFTEGQPVKRGQVLAQIDPRPFLVQLHTAEGALARDQAQLANAKTAYARQQSLREQNLISQQAVDDAKAAQGQAEGALAIDRASVENARLQLDYAQIKSPIDGLAGVRQVDAGNLVHASDPNGVVVITQLDQAAVFFSVAEDELPAISKAMAKGAVTVEARSRDGQTLLGTGTALALDNQINASTATLRVKALIPNPDRALWPNQFVKARMLVDTIKGAVIVPTVAVQRGPQGAFVYMIDAGLAKMVPIETGDQVGDVTVVTKGVKAGDQVVVEGANQLRPGAKVELPGAAPAGSGAGHKGKGRGP
jgi:multidrug efflux system membrane fusion protein